MTSGEGKVLDFLAQMARATDLARGFRPIPQLQLLADAEMRAGRPREALETIDRAIALFPRRAARHRGTGSGSGAACVRPTGEPRSTWLGDRDGPAAG
jgi:hypothetical protein